MNKDDYNTKEDLDHTAAWLININKGSKDRTATIGRFIYYVHSSVLSRDEQRKYIIEFMEKLDEKIYYTESEPSQNNYDILNIELNTGEKCYNIGLRKDGKYNSFSSDKSKPQNSIEITFKGNKKTIILNDDGTYTTNSSEIENK